MNARVTPRVSLVVATVDRSDELDALLTSLEHQAMPAFEVVVVDQNADDRVPVVIARHPALDIVHATSPRGLSRSRNRGMALARGDIVAFPDDDCRYLPDTLARVVSWFDANPGADGLTGFAQPEPGQRPAARFARHAHWLNRHSVWLGGVSCVIFLRVALVARIGGFDEVLGLGAGTLWTASEETDYLARAVAASARIRFEPHVRVLHPGRGAALPANFSERGFRYGRAFGHVMHRNGCSSLHLHVLVLRAVAGAGLALLRARPALARYHMAVARGRWRGWRDPWTVATVAATLGAADAAHWGKAL